METKTIYAKLLDFQKQNITILKDGKNPHFKSTYCTLNEVLDKIKKPLNDLGIVIIFEPQETGLKTILHDTENNSEVSGFMKYVDCGNAQKLLACNTYFRRGTLVSLLGLEDEDDDGNKASEPAKEHPLQSWIDELKKCKTEADLNHLFAGNKETVSNNHAIKELFSKRKLELK